MNNQQSLGFSKSESESQPSCWVLLGRVAWMGLGSRGHNRALTGISLVFFFITAVVVSLVSYRGEWNYGSLRNRQGPGLTFATALEVLEGTAGSWGGSPAHHGVVSFITGASSGFLQESGFQRFTRNVVFSVILGFLLPIWCLSFSINGLGNDRESNTLFWLLCKPVPRWVIYLGRWLSVLPWVLVFNLGCFFVLSLCVGQAGIRVFLEFWPAIALACLAYSSIFFYLGACWSRPAMIALGYAFILETFLGNMPGSLKQLSVAFYSRSMILERGEALGIQLERSAVFLPYSQSGAVMMLAGIALVFLAWGIFSFQRMEWRGEK
ncbi:MAG: hypothetical protein EXR99_01385 [Gemmataceae bacterium]|nr:hypothetical protein [Gemmataceae bacterium]